ncbi:orphan sodium- and chloride-dependent neurotransmitter transporter NTT5-like isoform X2 [Phacochoerus africanus]|uniref:orphan sodium- and chloride-dependent neurotransmitter transporter NTT5-like isoform X2 n=1 Tax=Phacochoerus africanus TaxID=41426 RepID=UPI001FD98FDE|nr:orphan sodium- and chloride-dependent neurotransmitter transporter NTT5-like isoform X2 [Phacochoerus africanus]
MESLEEISEEEVPKEHQTSSTPSWKLSAKEILAAKTQNYFAQTKRTENVLVQVAFSVGLSSIWRFPYLCHRNGGGSFILMYFFMLLLFGIPLLYMEMIMGKWLRVDNIRVWKQLVPWLGGIGYAGLLVCTLVSLYNSSIITWSLSYLGNSFDHPLPWNQCPPMKSTNVTDVTCLRTVSHQYFWYHNTLNASNNIEEGFEVLVLNLSLGIFAVWLLLFLILVTGLKMSMQMLVFSVLLPYITLFCFLIRGLLLEGATTSLRRMVTTELSAWASLDLWCQAGGHVLYSLGLGMGTIILFSYDAGGDNYAQVASLVALVNLVTSLLTTSIIFMVLGFWTTTSGHACVKQSVSKLMKLIEQGVLSQDATPPEDILLLPSLDYLDWISSLPDHLQHQIVYFSPSCSIKAQKEKFMEGPGLAFAAFSQIISLFPGASFWAILFFMGLLIIGLSTLIKLLEGIVSPIQNSISIFRDYPRMLSGMGLLTPVTTLPWHPSSPGHPQSPGLTLTPDPALHTDLSGAKPASALAIVCLGGFLGSLVFTSRAGSYVMSLFDDYLVPISIIIVVAFQNMALVWIYGARRFREELFSELGHPLWPFPTFLWCYVTLPGLLALLALCLVQFYQSTHLYYIAWDSSASQEVKQPYLQRTLGWVTFLSILTFLPIPIHPLRQWWCLPDCMAPDPLENLMSKKMTLVSPQPVQWPKHHSKSTFTERKSDMSSRGLSLPSFRGPNWGSWHFSPASSRSGSSSWFSLPLPASVTSALSIRSASLPASRQVSPVSTAIDNSNEGREAKEENAKEKSSQ